MSRPVIGVCVATYNQGQYIESCLRSKGYVMLTRPMCTTDAERAKARRATTPDQFTCVPGDTGYIQQ